MQWRVFTLMQTLKSVFSTSTVSYSEPCQRGKSSPRPPCSPPPASSVCSTACRAVMTLLNDICMAGPALNRAWKYMSFYEFDRVTRLRGRPRGSTAFAPDPRAPRSTAPLSTEPSTTAPTQTPTATSTGRASGLNPSIRQQPSV
ncbi:hypothetical protein B0T26DRAFT_683138 [Lasiosphaeria miniovina]|uniref:Uncharacterized protein n=1 Tax=Lasiosphaeria miniovina TaxID=1954250 RepID=A0AA40BFC3_9PEZI|nr:uncharacterized protein B0T26DRAFT_683138 [Lasiosphaeria miniovina]KAK0733214.1 hypothetical protein B0T26DRAFT_683138 [Lasiosphaeria miniovina]